MTFNLTENEENLLTPPVVANGYFIFSYFGMGCRKNAKVICSYEMIILQWFKR